MISYRGWIFERVDQCRRKCRHLHRLRLQFYFSLSCIGEGNGNPLQCSCLENPRDGGAGGLPSTGSHWVGHDWSDLVAAAAEERQWTTGRLKEDEMTSVSPLTQKHVSFALGWRRSLRGHRRASRRAVKESQQSGESPDGQGSGCPSEDVA